MATRKRKTKYVPVEYTFITPAGIRHKTRLWLTIEQAEIIREGVREGWRLERSDTRHISKYEYREGITKSLLRQRTVKDFAEELVGVLILDDFMKTLAPTERAILQYRIVFDFTFRTIASRLGMAETTVRRLYKATIRKAQEYDLGIH